MAELLTGPGCAGYGRGAAGVGRVGAAVLAAGAGYSAVSAIAGVAAAAAVGHGAALACACRADRGWLAGRDVATKIWATETTRLSAGTGVAGDDAIAAVLNGAAAVVATAAGAGFCLGLGRTAGGDARACDAAFADVAVAGQTAVAAGAGVPAAAAIGHPAALIGARRGLWDLVGAVVWVDDLTCSTHSRRTAAAARGAHLTRREVVAVDLAVTAIAHQAAGGRAGDFRGGRCAADNDRFFAGVRQVAAFRASAAADAAVDVRAGVELAAAITHEAALASTGFGHRLRFTGCIIVDAGFVLAELAAWVAVEATVGTVAVHESAAAVRDLTALALANFARVERVTLGGRREVTLVRALDAATLPLTAGRGTL